MSDRGHEKGIKVTLETEGKSNLLKVKSMKK